MVYTTNGTQNNDMDNQWYTYNVVYLIPPQASKIPKDNPKTKEMTGQGKPKIRTEQTQCSF